MIVKEYIEFERGLDPKKSMDIGMKILDIDGMGIPPKDAIYPFSEGEVINILSQKRLFNEEPSKNLLVSKLGDNNEIKYSYPLWALTREPREFHYIRFKDKLFPIPSYPLEETVNFERGLDPKKSLDIGKSHLDKEFIKSRNWYFNPDNKERWEVVKLIRNYKGHPILVVKDKKYNGYIGSTPARQSGGASSDTPEEAIRMMKIWIDTKIWTDKRLKESLDFQRGMDPKQSMDIGHFAKINKITTSDLELLKVYTNDGGGKGHEDEEWFREVYESSASCEEYLERAKEVYKLLEPYEYMFGDSFEFDMKKEMKSYISSYLKNPRYNYAYNCDIMEDETYEIFFSEVKLPAAELLGKKPRLKESLDFERGQDPKATMGIGVKDKIRQGILGLLQSSRGAKGVPDTRISTINLLNNLDESWLEISDYGTRDFEDVFYSFLPHEYFRVLYVKAKPQRFKSSWKNDWKAIIKDEYRDFFKACFDQEGFIIESVNFERGIDPMNKMGIGRVEERKQKLIDQITSEDPLKWSGSSVLAHLLRTRFPFYWDREKFKEESIEDLEYYLKYIQKWNKIDKRYKVFDGPASTVQENL